MEGYSLDLRERIVEAVKGGMGKSQVARVYGVGRATVYRYMELDHLGDLAPQPHPGPGQRLDETGCEKLLKQVENYPDLSLEEHADKLSKDHKLKLKKSSIGNYCKRLGIRRKKNATSPKTK
jgi:transposase